MSAAVRQRLAALPRVRLSTARPPLERWDRVSETLGITFREYISMHISR